MKLHPVLFMPGLLLAAAAPFWEAKPAAEWTLDQAQTLLVSSPWAQVVEAESKNPAPPVAVYLATAEPVQLAEDRLRLASKRHGEDPSWTEYREYLVENASKFIVVAVGVLNPEAYSDNSETGHMERESQLRIGKRKYRVAGHFPPSSTDRHVRLVFPREILPGDRTLVFELYVPGAGSPYRTAEFELKTLVFHGRPSY